MIKRFTHWYEDLSTLGFSVYIITCLLTGVALMLIGYWIGNV